MVISAVKKNKWIFLAVFIAISLIITVVIYVLVKPENSSSPCLVSSASSCSLPSGFICRKFGLSNDGNLFFELGQATGKTIIVNELRCSNYVNNSSASLIRPVEISNGKSALISNGSVTCFGASSGKWFDGNLRLGYLSNNSNETQFIEGEIHIAANNCFVQ